MTAPRPSEPHCSRDPGLQAERTSLAWQRTGVAGSTLAASAMLSAAHLDAAWVLAVVTLISAACAAAVGVAVRSARAGEGRASPWIRLLAVATIPLLLAAAGSVMALDQPAGARSGSGVTGGCGPGRIG